MTHQYSLFSFSKDNNQHAQTIDNRSSNPITPLNRVPEYFKPLDDNANQNESIDSSAKYGKKIVALRH